MTDHHILKTWKEPFQESWEGKKTHEFRSDDRGFRVGDVISLEEFEPANARLTGRSIGARITSISHGPDWGIPDGFVVFSFGVLWKHSGEAATGDETTP